MTNSQIPTLAFRDPPPDGVLPFEINSFEKMHPLAQSQHPHRINFYEILYITAGQGFHIIDFDAYPLQPPCVFFLSPGQVHFYQRLIPIEGYTLLFTEDFLLSTFGEVASLYNFDFFHGVQQSPFLPINQNEEIFLLQLISEVYKEYSANYEFRGATLQAYLHILLVKLQRLILTKSRRPPPVRAQTLVQQFKQLVSLHYLSERSVQYYADQIGLSLSHLSAIVKDVTGKTPGQVIRKNVALEAKRLLVHTDQTIEQVSHKLHFKDPPYFGRFFKRETGVSPGEFRKIIREKYQIVKNL